MRSWNLIIDVAKCEDCNNCSLACKDEHVGNDWPGYAAAQPLHGHRWMNTMRKERGTWPTIDVAYRPTPCMHCDDAPCLRAAAGGAVYKRADGIVLIDPQKASGPEGSWSRPAPTAPSTGTRSGTSRRSARSALICWTKAGRSRAACSLVPPARSRWRTSRTPRWPRAWRPRVCEVLQPE